MREQGPSGFCDPCYAEHGVERFTARDAAAITERRDRWASWTDRSELKVPDTPHLLRERQRRSRLLRRVRPKEPPPPGADPFELAQAALTLLHTRIRPSVVRAQPGSASPGVIALQEIEEIIRQLAWGPHPLPR